MADNAQLPLSTMSADELRSIALSFPKSIEKPHFDWVSFRGDACDDTTVRSALTISWRHAAPDKLHDMLDAPT